jgi:hypothetical protein
MSQSFDLDLPEDLTAAAERHAFDQTYDNPGIPY